MRGAFILSKKKSEKDLLHEWFTNLEWRKMKLQTSAK